MIFITHKNFIICCTSFGIDDKKIDLVLNFIGFKTSFLRVYF